MSKRLTTDKTNPRTDGGPRDRRSRSGQYEITGRGRSVRHKKDEPMTSRSRHGGKTVSRAARIVVRLHRDALKELEKY